MDGLRVLWIGNEDHLASAIIDLIADAGGWVSRAADTSAMRRHAWSADLIVVDARSETSAHALVVLAEHTPDASVLALSPGDRAAPPASLARLRIDAGPLYTCERIAARVRVIAAEDRSKARLATAVAAFRRLLSDSIGPLPPQQRAVLVGRALGLADKTTADVLGVATRTVNGHLAQARLRKQLRSIDDVHPLVLGEFVDGDLTTVLIEVLGDTTLALRFVAHLGSPQEPPAQSDWVVLRGRTPLDGATSCP